MPDPHVSPNSCRPNSAIARASDPGDSDPIAKVRASPRRELPVVRGSIDKVEGVVRKEDVLALCVDGKPISLESVLRLVPTVRAGASVLDTLSQFKRHAAVLAIVVDDQGRFAGVVTRTDLLEAIAGEFPAESESCPVPSTS